MSNITNSEENSKKAGDAISLREKIARDNHTEIERKRRSKMAGFYQEMADHVPACRSQNRKPDKLTIMKLAIEHITEIGNEGGRDSFLTEDELLHIISQVVDGFIISVQLDTMNLIYVSPTCLDILGIPDSDIYSSPFLSFIHPEDISKVQEYFSSQPSPRRAVDLRSGTLRREIRGETLMSSRKLDVCRIRCYNEQDHYCVVHMTGLVTASEEGLALACLVRRCEPIEDDPRAMSTKYDSSGIITFMDAKMSDLLGCPPNIFLGQSILDICHPEDQIRLKMSLDQAIELRGPPVSLECRLFAMNKTYVPFKMSHFAFINPHSGEFEFIVGCNYSYDPPKFPEQPFDCYSHSFEYSVDPSLYYQPDPRVPYYPPFKVGGHQGVQTDPNYPHYSLIQTPISSYIPPVQLHRAWPNETSNKPHYNFNKHYE